MKHATKKKLTKRERKAARGPNAAVMRSNGTAGIGHPLHKRAGGRIYTGCTPEYNDFTGTPIKVRAGVPFVRIS